MIRYVTYSSYTNEEISETVVRESETIFSESDSEKTVTKQKREPSLSKILIEFGGHTPAPSCNLAKKFTSDETGLYVIDQLKRVLVFTSQEMALLVGPELERQITNYICLRL